MVHLQSPTSLSIESPQGRKLFVFDRVFGPEVGQPGIWEYLEDCVNTFVQGYNVSLLAYGQSGAGKSYTMGTAGEQDDLDNMGAYTCGPGSRSIVLCADNRSQESSRAQQMRYLRSWPALGVLARPLMPPVTR